MRTGDRVEIYVPETDDHGVGTFHGRRGTLDYHSNLRARWFVHLDGDDDGVCVEFLMSEMISLPNKRMKLTPRKAASRSK